MKKKRKTYTLPLLIISIIIGLTYAYITSNPVDEMSKIQTGISEKIIRFHVIANSDSKEDQALKLEVKKSVVEFISPLLAESQSIQETENILNSNMPNIIAIANDVIKNYGYSYSVNAQICDTYFPTKAYGNYTFPPGIYRAFELKIGEAKGKNWWCVLYPPLCFIDISHGIVGEESENMLKETLTTEEFSAVSSDCKITYRFKYLKFLNNFL